MQRPHESGRPLHDDELLMKTNREEGIYDVQY
jgi:hypothetical protein